MRRAVDSRQSAKPPWSRHGWRLNADIIRLCLRKYWYMVSGILPVVGVPLPLVSYGGSALIVLMLGSDCNVNPPPTGKCCRKACKRCAMRKQWPRDLHRGRNARGNVQG